MDVKFKSKELISKMFSALGYKIIAKNTFNYDLDLTDQEKKILNYVLKNILIMGTIDNLAATILAVRYVCQNKIKGDFVECGVWRGGHGIAAALTFDLYKSKNKVICFDTFLGMTKPTDDDSRIYNKVKAITKFNSSSRETHNEWCYASFEEVENNFLRAGVSKDNFQLIKGDVAETLPIFKVDAISFLRLDTDWYESTKVELKYLWPLLSVNGLLVVDDYGHWQGSKKAVDEFFQSNPTILFHATDYRTRSGIKIK
jgi:O-methyltransferase